MATTSPDNIWTQDSADNYDLVVDAAATAASIQTALVARANSYKGTTAQRTAFTATAPEGTTWADTNGDKILWIKQGAVWVRVWPALPTTPEDNKIFVGGIAYTGSGIWPSFQVPVWAISGTNSHAATTHTLPLPYEPPPGYGFTAHLLSSPGFTWVSTANPVGVTNPVVVTIRIMQLFATTRSTITCGWTLVKTT